MKRFLWLVGWAVGSYAAVCLGAPPTGAFPPVDAPPETPPAAPPGPVAPPPSAAPPPPAAPAPGAAPPPMSGAAPPATSPYQGYPPAGAPPAPDYSQVLGPYVRPPDATMPGYDTDPRSAQFVVFDRRGRYRHDGFYLRLGGGIGTTLDSVESDRPLPTVRQLRFNPDRFQGDASGMSAATEVAVGVSVFRGLVLGAGVYTATIPGPEAEMSDPRTGAYVYRVSQLALLSALADFYFDREMGFHAQAGIGLSAYVAGVADPEVSGPRAQAHTAIGFGFMVGAGYDWWVSEQWSIGLLARLLYGSMSGSDSEGVEWSHTAIAPAALVTATYH